MRGWIRTIYLTKASVSTQGGAEGVRIVRGTGEKDSQIMSIVPSYTQDTIVPAEAVKN